MRAILSLIAALLLAGCTTTTREVSATAPTISFRVTGNDLSQANLGASRYCQQYGMASQLQGLQPNGSENVATYSCTSSTALTGPGPGYGNYGSSAAPTVLCADALHQDRPGGADYHGPPVAGCPRTY